MYSRVGDELEQMEQIFDEIIETNHKNTSGVNVISAHDLHSAWNRLVLDGGASSEGPVFSSFSVIFNRKMPLPSAV